jgi:hypothetical protein
MNSNILNTSGPLIGNAGGAAYLDSSSVEVQKEQEPTYYPSSSSMKDQGSAVGSSEPQHLFSAKTTLQLDDESLQKLMAILDQNVSYSFLSLI